MADSNSADIAAKDWQICSGQAYRQMVQAGMLWLDRNHQYVNSLNVFPVPDGDTGTNMLLTMRAAYRRVTDNEETHVGKMAEAVAQGALMGARGNSGVILSQIWRGLAQSLKEKESFNATEFAAAMQAASDTAYKGVMKPVEGTILTVVREGAEEAQDAASKSSDLIFVFERILDRFEQALARTPDLLPILKQAGVVDSGGQGLIYIFNGMLQYMRGELTVADIEAMQANGGGSAGHITAQALAAPIEGDIENPYDVQFILLGENLDVLAIRDKIDSMGDSTVVVGDETTVKVHIHVEDPGEPLSYGISLGKVTDVVVENMQLQMEEIIATGETVGAPAGFAHPSPLGNLTLPTLEPGQIGVVAVAPGDGLAAILTSLGVTEIVHGGQTNNPSTEELFQAIQDVPSDKVIILPNNKNIILAAEAARDLSPKQVAVVPTRTVPQGISAMIGLNPDGELAPTAASMQRSAQDVATGEITVATRTVEIDGVQVQEGNVIGLIDGKLVAAAEQIDAVLTAMLAKVEMEDCEIVSLYYGADASQYDAEALAAKIEAQYDEVEVEILAGGQAHYHYILGIE